MIHFLSPGRVAAAFALLLGCLTLAWPPAVAAVTADEIESLLASVNADSSLDDESRANLIEQLGNASSQLDVAIEQQSQSSRLKADIEQAPAKAASFEQQLGAAKSAPQDYSNLVPPESSVGDIEGQITLATAQRQSLGDRRSQLLKAVDEMPGRRVAIKERLVALQQIIDSEQSVTPATAEDTIEKRVSWLLSQARLQAAEAEKESLETEILGEDSLSQANATERAWLGQAISDADARLVALNSALEKARASANKQQLETTSELQEKLQTADPLLQKFAEDNRELAELLQDTANKSAIARRDIQRTQSMLEGIVQDSQLMHRRLEVAGRKEVLGKVMITRLDSLPDPSAIKDDIEERNELIGSTSLTQIDIEEDFRALNEGSKYLLQLAPDLDQWDEESKALVQSLVEQRAQLLEKNLSSLGSLVRMLLDNNDKARELIVATRTFHKFLLGNLLWIRNFSYLGVGELYQQLSILANPVNWLQVPSQLISGYLAAGWSSALLLALLLVFIARRQLMPVYRDLLSSPMLLSGATLWNIVAGFALSFLLVLPWPLALYLVGYLLEATKTGSTFTDAMAPALMYSARILYLLLLTRLIINRMGVGRRYLKWDARMLDILRDELNWAGPLMCIAILLDVFAFEYDPVTSGGPLGAITTAMTLLIIIVFALRLLAQEVFKESSMVKLGLRMAIVIAAASLAMQAMGLIFAADIYVRALGRSIMFLLAIKTVADVLERWLLILRARMEREAKEAQKALEDDNDDNSPEEQERQIDLLSLSEAHTKLLSMARIVATVMALWLIWSPSLPALNLLETITLWSVVDSTNPGVLKAITLFDLALSVVIIIVTVLLTRHLPSLSEVFMREWFNISSGARYASSILMQYVVIAIGGSMFLTTIGWEWSKVQWLVAALGVGIGFGLQEIVANFVSGIIILFERPVRVGDIISAGGAEGVVQEIKPRATIIETFDRKEHLIPNKELITGQVINWTLSDAAIRVVIPVGVAYGSDPRLAMALMLEAASEVENVMEDPAARASFEDFGDNALILWLRCYISDDRIGTWTELRNLINEKFNEAGIVISFPQRDVHLDTQEPLQLEIRNLDALRDA